MLALIISLFSSSGVGSLIGWLGGLLNRKVDLDAKKAEYAYNLALRDKDLAETQAEVAGRIAVADREIDEAKETARGMIESAAYNAMAESYKEQSAPLGGKWAWVDAVSKLIRPFVTLIFVAASLTLSGVVFYQAYRSGVVFTTDTWQAWLDYVVRWVFFQAGVVIGWWFANRPSGRGDK